MEFFSDHWLLWVAFLVPALVVYAVTKAAGKARRLGEFAGVVAYVAGILLGFGLIHVVVGWIVR